MSVRQIAINWLIGAVAATLVMWLATPYFIESIKTYTFHDKLELYVRPEGSSYQNRKEGWVTSKYGDLGIAGLDETNALPSSQPLTVIWGDSHIEALQVPDVDKTAAQANRLVDDAASKILGIGRAGYSVVDYVECIPRYERCLSVKTHVILIAAWSDFLPNGNDFVSAPNFEIKEQFPPPKLFNIKQLFADYRLEMFYWGLYRTLYNPTTNKRRKLRLGIGPVEQPKPGNADEISLEVIRQTWVELVNHIKSKTDAEVVFVYSPFVPIIEKRSVNMVDPDLEYVQLFAGVCKELDVAFIDLTDEFCKLQKETGQFPRGFHNGKISRGHFNKLGHQILADVLVKIAMGEHP